MIKKLSIVIPCYNDPLFISQSIDSALSQSYGNKEVIIVDDGSNLETKEIIDSFNSRIDLLITQQNKGLSAARNEGIKQAKGDYIIVLDSDDYFAPTFAEKAINIIRSKESCKIVTCQARRFDQEGTIDIFTPIGGDLQNFLFQNSAIGNSLFKKSDWFEIGGYDENMTMGFEDWEFYIRLLELGGYAHVIKEPLFNYRQKNISMRKEANQVQFEIWEYIFKKNRRLYIKHHDKLIENYTKVLRKERNQLLKLKVSKEYIVGSLFLRPLRFLKNIF